MIFTVLFEDNPGKHDLRRAHMQDHLAFLDRQSGVLGAGPLFDNGGNGQGGLWVVEAETLQDVEAMLADDPFRNTGLRKSITVLEWRQVVRDGVRL